MSAADMSAVLNILRSLYRHIQTLEEFADSIEFKEGKKPVLICTLPELLAFVLNTMKRKRRRNVLAHGYNLLALPQEDRDADHFKFQGDVTQSAAYVHGSDLWKKVTLRLGTDITRYLLESCSVFVAVPPSCVFQVCGVPVYDRVSTGPPSSGFHLQPRLRGRSLPQFGRDQRSRRFRRRQEVENLAQCQIRRRRKEKGNKRRRKRGLDQLEEETGTSSGKRRRNVENGTTGFKQTIELPSTEGGPSWRSGAFPPLPPSQCFIRTLGFLYGGRGLHSFLLNRKKKSTDGSRRLQGKDLIRVVFFEGLMYLNGLERKPKKLPQRFFNMVPLFSRLLRQHKKCPYSKILQRICPLVEECNTGPGELNSLLPKHCAPHRVFLFVRECLSTVIPREMWGSDHNRVHFFAKARVFLHSGKFERLSLAELMWNMKVNDCDWLKISKTGRIPPSELAYRTQILGHFLTWLLDGFVVGLVRACFYATESVGQKNAIRFYRQEVWTKLQDLAFKGHLSKGQMEELSPAQAASLPKGTVISRLRFIPKSDGMRPITRVIGTDPKTRLFQARVRDLLDMLRACVRSTPSLLGATVWGMTDIHKVLSSLAPAQKDRPQPLYFVKVDVSGAYESLPHDKLIEVIGQALCPVQNEFFTIRRYAKIWADSHEGLKKAFVRQADFLEDNMGSTNMKGFLMSLQKSAKLHHAILVEQHFCSDLRGKEASQFFTQMLTGSVVQYGKKTYHQCRGIPQGSVVSCLLCCLCYGHMENVLFKDITKSKGCLMRLVDDFLLITPDQHQAQTFLKTLLAGVPQYGLMVNPQKVAVNFQLPGSVGSCTDIRMLPPHCLFPWCGLLLDTHSLDVYKDYSRKLMAILRLKCHPLFLDLKTNSLEAVYRNIYKLVVLHACRFHVCAQSLPFGQTVAKNPLYFLQMIWDMAQYANKLLRSSNKGLILGSKAQTGIVQYEAVELLFCLSFLLVLSQHRQLYRDLLTHLHKRKRRLERRLGDLRLARVRQASNPRTPVDFLAIRM
uniref:Telomerase reverse transcriptase n=1 Tax=Xiphophorus couchianus TaxID=32473 RepID=A0A3B5KXR5_9TELE